MFNPIDVVLIFIDLRMHGTIIGAPMISSNFPTGSEGIHPEESTLRIVESDAPAVQTVKVTPEGVTVGMGMQEQVNQALRTYREMLWEQFERVLPQGTQSREVYDHAIARYVDASIILLSAALKARAGGILVEQDVVRHEISRLVNFIVTSDPGFVRPQR